jgi:hypothetical protein
MVSASLIWLRPIVARIVGVKSINGTAIAASGNFVLEAKVAKQVSVGIDHAEFADVPCTVF